MLRMHEVTMSFGGVTAVNDLSWTVAPGELAGLIGPNGAGKTTVFNIISGLYRPQKGTVSFRDHDITGKDPYLIARLGIGRTFQHIRLFGGLTVLDNIRIAHDGRAGYTFGEALIRSGRCRRSEDLATRRALELLASFDLDSLADRTARTIPYGLQRKIEIVRALATGANFLLLDEPAAGLNPREIDGLMDFVRSVRETHQLTIVVIEHQMRLVMNLCERITVLDFGSVIAQGTPAAVASDRAVIEAYLGEEEKQ